MKYMLLIYMGERAVDEADREHCYAESAQLARDLHSSGQYVAANPLHPVSTATSVRVRDGIPLVTDGRADASRLLQDTVAPQDFFEKSRVQGGGEALLGDAQLGRVGLQQ